MITIEQEERLEKAGYSITRKNHTPTEFEIISWLSKRNKDYVNVHKLHNHPYLIQTKNGTFTSNSLMEALIQAVEAIADLAKGGE